MGKREPVRELEIEDGIPIPPKRKVLGIRPKLRALKIGQSLVLKKSSLSNAGQILGKGNYRIATLKNGRVRVWRTG